MTHSIPLITTLATAFGLALILGFIAARLKLPILVGYLVTGILIGPYTPGIVANVEIARELSEIGVMLLMFGVGLHFSLNDLIAVRKVAVPGALLQIVVATFLGTWLAYSWHWPLGGSLIFGLALSVASTVVLLRALEVNHLMDAISGHIAIGWLVVEDLAMILVIVLLHALSTWFQNTPQTENAAYLGEALLFTVLKVSFFIMIMMVIGRKVFPKLLWHITRVGSRELFTLCVIATAISVAFIASKLFGVSFALGAFFAGMMMRESPLSHRAAEESLPLREAFAVLFFVSVGMLFDPSVLIHHTVQLFAVVGIIIFGKSIAALLLVVAFRYPLTTAFVVSVSLAQIGEFSFILADLGVRLGLMPETGQSLILAGAIISIALNPLLFKLMKPCQSWLTTYLSLSKESEMAPDPLAALPITTEEKYLSGQVIIVGYGRVGKYLGEALFNNGIPFVVAEQNREIVEMLRARKIAAVFGNAAEPEVLLQTHLIHGSMLVLAIPNMFDIQQMIKTAQMVNPKIKILVRVHNEEAMELFIKENVEKIFFSEYELAQNISQYILMRYGIHLESLT